MASTTPTQAREYIERWRLVRELEAAEARGTSLETKFRQLAVLMASRNLFGDDGTREKRIRDVRDRWARIRRALDG